MQVGVRMAPRQLLPPNSSSTTRSRMQQGGSRRAKQAKGARHTTGAGRAPSPQHAEHAHAAHRARPTRNGTHWRDTCVCGRAHVMVVVVKRKEGEAKQGGTRASCALLRNLTQQHHFVILGVVLASELSAVGGGTPPALPPSCRPQPVAATAERLQRGGGAVRGLHQQRPRALQRVMIRGGVLTAGAGPPSCRCPC